MAWIELHQSVPTHRKTLALADALNIKPVQAVGHLACLWLWALDNAPDGSLIGVTPRMIARAAQWDKDAESLVAALAAAGFIDSAPDSAIHDWDDYAGKLVEQRELRRSSNRDAQARRRQRLRHDPVSTDNDDSQQLVSADGHRQESARQQSTGPDLTVPSSPLTPQGDSKKAVPKPKREHVPITEQDVEDLIDKYAARYGTPQAVRDEIELALNHEARFKNIRERLYVDGWLRREFTRRPVHTGRNGRPEPERHIIDRTGQPN